MSKGNHKKNALVWNGYEFDSMENMAIFCETSPQLIRYYLRVDKAFKGHFIDYAIKELEL